MTSAFIGATVVVVLYSLWVRRDTWWSRWEIGISTAIALEGFALILLSPWAARTLGPWMHEATGVWNLQQMTGHLFIMMAIAANAYHVMARLADFEQMRSLFRRQVKWPARVCAPTLMVLFVVADADYRPDGFSTDGGGGWADAAYWVLLCALLIYLSAYATRLLLMVRSDPRAKETVELYTASSAFALAAITAQLSTVWTNTNVSPLVWFWVCVSVSLFAFGSARSWRAKAAWFTAGASPVLKESKPPQAFS